MNVRILLHKPKKWDWLGQGIRFWTGLVSAKNRTVGPYDHAEVWTAHTGRDGEEYFTMWNFDVMAESVKEDKTHKSIVGTCWTSTMRGEDNGTVKRPASEVVHSDERWDVCEIDIAADYKYECGMNWMKAAVIGNQGYSKWDLLKFVSPIHLPDKKRNICSEFVNYALYYMGVWDDFGIVSPRRLAYKLVQAGLEIKSLKDMK